MYMLYCVYWLIAMILNFKGMHSAPISMVRSLVSGAMMAFGVFF